MPVEPGMARRRSSTRNPREAPAEVEARRIWAAVASAGQVQNWLDAAEARRLKRSIVRCCRVMSKEGGGSAVLGDMGSSAVLCGMGSGTVLRGTGS